MDAGGPARREETNKDNKQEGRKRRVDVQERERGPRRTPTVGTNITENWAPQSDSQRGTGALRGAVTQRGAVTGGVYRTERLPSKRNRDQAMGSEEMEEAPPAKH